MKEDTIKKLGAATWLGAKSWFSGWIARLHRPAPTTPACPRCGTELLAQPGYRQFRICDHCGRYFPMPARMWARLLADDASLVEFSSVPKAQPRPRFYKRPVYRAPRRQTLLSGTASIAGQPVVLLAFDFRHVGGTMGVKEGQVIARAFEHAAEQKLPVVAIIASGGVRIQEGIPALLQMVGTIQALHKLREAGRAFVAVLTNPTTGGVYASFTSLADIILAEPGAIIGFAGPRVAEKATGEKMPPNSHRAEVVFEHGLIDALVPRQELRETLARVIQMTMPGAAQNAAIVQEEDGDQVDHEESADREVARRADRPTAREYMTRLCSDFVELHGDRSLRDDPSVVGGLATFRDQNVVVIAQQRRREQQNERGAGPAGYHKAERLVQLASRLGLPIISFVDTPGADPGLESERYGIASAIAHCLDAFLQARVPTVALLIGEGISGGAIAFAATDRVLMQANATYEVISAQGASAILSGDHKSRASKAWVPVEPATDLKARGIVDRVIPEPNGGAHTDVASAAVSVGEMLEAALQELSAMGQEERMAARRKRYGSGNE